MPGAHLPSAPVLSPQANAESALSLPAIGKALLRPCAPGLIGLALMVFLWGLGYKLSLYHHHASASARPVVAKLWTGPRAVSLLRAPARSLAGAHALSATPRLFPPPATRAADRSRSAPGRVSGPRFLPPSRSPPLAVL